MTERKSLESERAELVALADDVGTLGGTNLHEADILTRAEEALRRLATPDQKPVAYCRCHDDVARKYCLDKDRCTPIAEAQAYLSPPPAAGWDEAIEACKKIATEYEGDAARKQVVMFIIRDIESLRHNAPMDVGAENPLLVVTYTNYRGETSVRRIAPKSIRFGSTEWHPEPQWLLLAYDTEKKADREFALKDFGLPDHGGADAGVKLPQGYALVPIKPTSAMVEAGCEHNPTQWNEGTDLGFAADVANDVYVAMVRAALSHQPAPVAANASAEARLREFTPEQIAAAQAAIQRHPFFDGSAVSAFGFANAAAKALFQHPHASDCDKQGER